MQIMFRLPALILFAAAALILQAVAGDAARSLSVFHVGNSFTGWGDIPRQVENFARFKNLDHRRGEQICDGMGLSYQWENGLPEGQRTRGTPVRSELESGQWDAVVLQPMSREFFPDQRAEFMQYTRRFAELAQQHGSRLYLYVYWPYRSEPTKLQDAINAGFAEVADQLSAEGFSVGLIPVGEVFRRVTQEIEAGNFKGLTRDDLYMDNIHPSDIGKYLASLVHFAILWQEDPVGLPAVGIRAHPASSEVAPIAPELAKALQRIVRTVVLDEPIGKSGRE